MYFVFLVIPGVGYTHELFHTGCRVPWLERGGQDGGGPMTRRRRWGGGDDAAARMGGGGDDAAAKMGGG